MSNQQMIQSREHPHYGELGWIDLEQHKKETDQYYFKLSNCQHGKAGCYVSKTDLTKQESQALEGEVLQPNDNGRPTEYGPEMIAFLSKCFEDGLNVTEACRTAGISTSTYYNWGEEHDGFLDTMEYAKGYMGRLAKNAARKALIAGDPATARWYLDRKDPDFKPKSEVDNNLGLQKTREKIKDFLNEPTDYDAEAKPDASGAEPSAPDAEAGAAEVASTTPDIS